MRIHITYTGGTIGMIDSPNGLIPGAELAHGLDCAAKQSAQHVAATVVGRTYAIGHDHQCGTHMVSHDAETHIHGFVIAIRAAGQLLGGFDDREDLVGLIDVDRKSTRLNSSHRL